MTIGYTWIMSEALVPKTFVLDCKVNEPNFLQIVVASYQGKRNRVNNQTRITILIYFQGVGTAVFVYLKLLFFTVSFYFSFHTKICIVCHK